MDGLYAEARAKKKMTVTDYVLKFLLIAGMVVFLGWGFLMFNFLYVIIGLIFVGLSYYFLPKFAVEYEYVFCDGQVDFDRISGGAKRKTMMRVDFDHLVILAPKDSHALDGYRRNDVVVKDFSSLDKNAKMYGMVLKNGEKNTIIYFEPSEKMLTMMKQKAPRKIVEA